MSPSADDQKRRDREAVASDDPNEREAVELLLKEEGAKPLTDEQSGPPPAEAKDPEVFPLADAGPYFAGLWSDQYPAYKCPYCLECQLADSPEEGNGAIELHILARIDAGDVRHMEALNTRKES